MSLNSFRVGLGHVMNNWIGKTLVVVIGVLLVFSFVYSGMPGGRGGAGAVAGAGQGDTIATVNGDAITREDYQQTLQAYTFGQTTGPMMAAFTHAQALDQLLQAKMSLQQAKKLGLKVSDDEIAKERQKAVAQSNLATTLGLKPNASLADVDAALAKAGAPSLEDQPRYNDEAIRQSLLLDKLQTYLNNKVAVSEQDARDSFQQWHTRHILIDTKKRSDVQAQAQANEILAKAKAPGADFAAMARQYSDDPGTKAQGGDDGWIDQKTGYVPEFKTAAFALKPGEVTLVKSPQYGYFIIKLEATRSNLPKDFDKKKADYIAQVKQQKQQQAQQDFLKSLKDNPANKIVISDPQLRADREAFQAVQEGDPAKKQALYQSALKDYQLALKGNPPLSQQGEINAQIAQIYQNQLNQPAQALTAYEAAVTASDDPDLRMILADLYRKNKQPDKAVEQYQAASKQAWNNLGLHEQVMGAFLQLKRPDLAAQEKTWIKDYQDRQKQQQASMPFPGGALPGGTGGAPISLNPSGAGGSSGGIKVSTTPSSGGVKVVPASGAAASDGKKPTQ